MRVEAEVKVTGDAEYEDDCESENEGDEGR